MSTSCKNLEISDSVLLDKAGDTYAELLTIHQGGSLAAGEGLTVTLTAGGIERKIAPGKYVDAVISVREDFHSTVLNHLREYGFRTGLYVENGKVFPERSVESALVGGRHDEHGVSETRIYSEGEGFNGLVLSDVGDFRIKDLKIRANGNGRSDFSGRGSGILVTGKSNLLIDGYDFVSDGVVRNAITATDGAKVHIKNSDITAYSGTDEERIAMEQSRVAGHMIGVPWVLGLWGNNRATNIIGTADVLYENCSVRAESWGLLSVDGIDDPDEFGQFKVNLTARNCDLELFGKSGYGVYAIHASRDVFDNCRVRVPDYAAIISNEYSAAEVINGTVIDAGRNGFMWHQNQGGILNVKDSTVRSGRAVFQIKACYPDIRVENSVIESANGTILELIDLDDPGLGAAKAVMDASVPVKDESHDICSPNYATVNMSGFIRENYLTDAKACFKNVTLKGDFYNATTNAARVGIIYPDDFQLPSGLPDEEPEPIPEGKSFLDMFPPSSVAPVNLLLEFEDAEITGVITASRSKHNVETVSPEQWYELGVVTHTPCEPVNNGVIVTMGKNVKWKVTGKSFLSALTIDESACICSVNGGQPALYVDGKETPLRPGAYSGNIIVAP